MQTLSRSGSVWDHTPIRVVPVSQWSLAFWSVIHSTTLGQISVAGETTLSILSNDGDEDLSVVSDDNV